MESEIFGADAVALEVPRTALKGLENNPNVHYMKQDQKRSAIALTTPLTGTPYATGKAVAYGITQVRADLQSDINIGNAEINLNFGCQGKDASEFFFFACLLCWASHYCDCLST